MLFDSHTHLDFVDDLPKALARAKKADVLKIISVGTNFKESKKAIEIAEKYSKKDQQIFASCGIHPKDGKEDVKRGWIDELKSVVNSSGKVIALGECGLDYYLPSDKRVETADKEKRFQREIFSQQIKLASEMKLPLIVHCRNAWNEIIDLIEKNKSNDLTGVFHSWTGDTKAMKKALEIGFYISFSGIVTFKNVLVIQEVAKKIPTNKMLVETDSPFLAPEPVRGQKNEPGNVRIIAEFLAETRSVPVDDIISDTSSNAQKLFNLL